MQRANWPERLELHTEWRRFDQGGLDDIKEWCEAHPERRLIWIDTLAKVRPIAGKNEQAYTGDYRAIEGLQKLAGEYQVGIVLNHHLRKAASEDDAFDDVSGTLGLTGAADTIIVMKRHAGMVKVFVRGRDIEEAEFAAEFNKDTCRWRLVGVADEVFRSEQRQAIAKALKEAARSMSVAEIMAATERHDRHATQVLLLRMEIAGEVKHTSRGMWAAEGADPLNASDFGDLVTNGSQATENNTKSDTDESHSKVTEVTAPERADPPETLRPVWRSRARSAAGWYGQGWGQAAPGMRPLLAQGPSTMSMWKTDRFALGVAGCAMRGIFLCRVDRAVFCGDKNEKRPENPRR